MSSESINGLTPEDWPGGDYCVDFSFQDSRLADLLKAQDLDNLKYVVDTEWSSVSWEEVDIDGKPVINLYFRGPLKEMGVDLYYYGAACLSIYDWLKTNNLKDARIRAAGLNVRYYDSEEYMGIDITAEAIELVTIYETFSTIRPNDFD